MMSKKSILFWVYNGPKMPIAGYYKYKAAISVLFDLIKQLKLRETGYYDLNLQLLDMVLSDFTNRTRPFPIDQPTNEEMVNLQNEELNYSLQLIKSRIIIPMKIYHENCPDSGFDGFKLISCALDAIINGLLSIEAERSGN